MLEGARFAGVARTLPHFHLVSLGPYPAMIRGGNTAVLGELYVIDEARIPELDDFEGHPELYQRCSITLEGGAEAETYVLPAELGEGKPALVSGDWRKENGRR